MTQRVVGTVYVIGGHGFFREHEGGEVPVPQDMPGVKGVFLGGCISRGLGRLSEKKNGKAYAHAHIKGDHKGWVCFQLPEYLENEYIRMHELAHILTGEAHTK